MIKSDFNNGDTVKFRDYRTGYIHTGIVGLMFPIIGTPSSLLPEDREKEKKETQDMLDKTIWVYDNINHYRVDLSKTSDITILKKSEVELTWQEVLAHFSEQIGVSYPTKQIKQIGVSYENESHSDNS